MRSRMLLVAFIGTLAVASPLHNDEAQTDEATKVLSDLSAVSSDVSSMNSAIQAYTGGLSAALPIESAAIKLEKDIKTTTTDTNDSSVFTSAQSDTITQKLLSLQPLIEKTLNDLIAKESLASEAGLNAVVVSDLKNIKGKTDNLGVALEDKTTSADASKIKTGIAALNSAFAAAIEKFS